MDTKVATTVLILLTLIIYIANIDCCALRLDDWCQLGTFKSLSRVGVWHTLKNVFTNEWVSGASRTNFLSFYLKYVLYLIWGYNYVPYYVFIFVLHCAIALLLFVLLRPLDRWLALSSALFSLLIPTAQQVLFWNNNIFFVVPVFFYLLYLFVYIHPKHNRIADLLCLIILFTATQFSGEQLILTLYLTPVAIALLAFAQGKRALRSALPRIVVPPIICAVLFILYIKYGCTPESRLAGGFKDIRLRFDPKAYFAAGHDTIIAIVRLFNVKSWMYGGFSITPSLRTILLTMCSALLLLAGFAVYHSREHDDSSCDSRIMGNWFLLLIVLAILFAFCGLFPMVCAVVSGIRVVEPRYFYILNIPIAIIASIVIKCLSRRSALMYEAIVLLTSVYLSFLTCYALHENWRYAKEYDKKVWAAVTREIRKGYNHILFVHVGKWWCEAISDFVQHYGITCYLRAHDYTEITFDRDTLSEANKNKKIVVIQVECPDNYAFLEPQIAVFPSYDSYLRMRH